MSLVVQIYSSLLPSNQYTDQKYKSSVPTVDLDIIRGVNNSASETLLTIVEREAIS